MPTRQRSPNRVLIAGLVVTLATMAAFSVYTVRQIRQLRDEQTAVSERNRRDSLLLLRIQNNLATLATAMRDMVERTEPYPMSAWRQTFDRLRADLDQALAQERALAPVGRTADQQARLLGAAAAFWRTLDQVFGRADAGDEPGAIALIQTVASAQHAELVGSVSQFLVQNTRVEEEAARLNRATYDRVERQIYVLIAGLLILAGSTGLYVIRANRRAFAEVERLSDQLRHLSQEMIRMQEALQQGFARELHDEFGQILAAMGTLLGRVKRTLPPDSPIVADLQEVREIAQDTLDKVRVQSRMLRPVILDDFGLDKALEWYVEQFGRQHGMDARFVLEGPPPAVVPEGRIHYYRIVQEALTNVSRHSGSRDAIVRLAERDGWIALDIEDHGRGLPEGTTADTVTQGIGLVGMRERTALLGGEFTLREAPGGGVIVSVRVPRGRDHPTGITQE